ncbi:MAG TPA: hypothetical protein VL123_06860 [Candidatus Udaeobacter sp.]|nr:hypothetical protein [Candidatus Udaeobacter sp.]
MKPRFRFPMWLPLLVFALAVTAMPSAAQVYTRSYAPAPPRVDVDFRFSPHWVRVSGTNVLTVRSDEHPDYDMFSLGPNYYIYDNGYWYRSDRWNGDYVAINVDDVPVDFQSVPQSMWRSYPTAWTTTTYRNDRNNDRYYYNVSNAPGPPAIYFRHNPRWVSVGAGVRMVSEDQRPPYDMFQFGGMFYIYDNGYWYRSSRWSGPFFAVDEGSIPLEIYNVPRDWWHSYPTYRTSSYQVQYRRHHRVIYRRHY